MSVSPSPVLHKLEIYADSFHEGDWAVQRLAKRFSRQSQKYLYGFLPTVTFSISTEISLEIVVFGSYKTWTPLPTVIADLIKSGKPDFIIYDPKSDQILFAVEETAATPTGNQALQRCERLFTAAMLKIPFIYLLAEFGVHLDGGNRRDSIWPTLLSIKLTSQHATQSLVIHYGNAKQPGTYSVGNGLDILESELEFAINTWFANGTAKAHHECVSAQYKSMQDFVISQYPNQISFLPGEAVLTNSRTKDNLFTCADPLSNDAEIRTAQTQLSDLCIWPTFSDLKPTQAPITVYIKEDPFMVAFVRQLLGTSAYYVGKGESIKPVNAKSISPSIKKQQQLFGNDIENKSARLWLSLDNFPRTKTGYCVSVVSKNLFLGDSTQVLLDLLQREFKLVRHQVDFDKPYFLFIINSVKPRRIFSDPYTGQIATYGPIFARDMRNKKSRHFIIYFPHQAHTQYADMLMTTPKSALIYTELVEYLVFHGGVTLDAKTGKRLL